MHLPMICRLCLHCEWFLLPDQALRCIGDLVARNPQNLDSLASKLVGEEPHTEPTLNAILRIILRTSIIEEFIAADYVFKCFCEVASFNYLLYVSQ